MLKVHSLTIKQDEKTIVEYGFELKSSLAIVGESGSGKSLTLKALLGMTPKSLQCEMDIECDFELLRGETVGFVPQSPFSSLSPMSKIKKQFFCSPQEAREAFDKVGLDEKLLERYPSELSGGQQQRAVIAMAIASRPKLMLLDEPTTALDKSSKMHVMELLGRLQEKLGFLTLFVTHEIETAKAVCDDICVLRHGRKIEEGSLMGVLKEPSQEYTKRLVNANFANRNFRE